MTTPAYAYTPTSPASITKALGEVFASMETDQQRYNRSANTNLLVAVSSVDVLPVIEVTIDAISVVHPSRFFVVYIDDSLSEVTTSISARCHGLSRSEHACSEVVRIGAPREKLWLIPSIVRGNLLVGTPAELFLADGAVPRELLDRLAPLADLIMFDSRDLADRVELIATIARASSNLLDLDWIELGPWREEVKTAFSKPMVCDHLAQLTEVVVTAGADPHGAPPFGALLLGGWIVEQLGLTHVMGRRGEVRAHLPGNGGHEVKIRLETEPGAATEIQSVAFRFAMQEGRIGEVRLRRGNGLEITVECGRSMRWSRPLERESREGLIRRYFLIGESTANYNASLRRAFHLRQYD